MQVDAQVERNDAAFKATFLNRRGQHPSNGPTAGFSTNDFRAEGTSDALAAMATSLAMNKVNVSVAGQAEINAYNPSAGPRCIQNHDDAK